ncbi:Uncharacterised protein [Chlamydia trachomatis]|nr:Uncharacterised protein [Chlamydia trachomatis]
MASTNTKACCSSLTSHSLSPSRIRAEGGPNSVGVSSISISRRGSRQLSSVTCSCSPDVFLLKASRKHLGRASRCCCKQLKINPSQSYQLSGMQSEGLGKDPQGKDPTNK